MLEVTVTPPPCQLRARNLRYRRTNICQVLVAGGILWLVAVGHGSGQAEAVLWSLCSPLLCPTWQWPVLTALRLGAETLGPKHLSGSWKPSGAGTCSFSSLALSSTSSFSLSSPLPCPLSPSSLPRPLSELEPLAPNAGLYNFHTVAPAGPTKVPALWGTSQVPGASAVSPSLPLFLSTPTPSSSN